MPSRQCILFATVKEAEASLKMLQAELITESLYKYSQGHILITGMGMEATQCTLSQFSDHFDECINLGIAGGLRKEMTKERLYPIARAASQEGQIEISPDGFHLYTHHSPLHDPRERDRLGREHHLVDMEGYTIAKWCQIHDKRCSLFKIVSDFCTETTSDEIRAALPALSNTLSQQLQQLLKR